MKVVINKCYGGFGLSDEAKKILGISYAGDISRTDPRLVEMVERDPEGTSGNCAELKVVEIPDEEGLEWEIEEYDGVEWIAENHRRWY